MEWIYSISLETMVIKGFIYKGRSYMWNDIDCLYYWTESDEVYLFDVPKSAQHI